MKIQGPNGRSVPIHIIFDPAKYARDLIASTRTKAPREKGENSIRKLREQYWRACSYL